MPEEKRDLGCLGCLVSVGFSVAVFYGLFLAVSFFMKGR